MPTIQRTAKLQFTGLLKTKYSPAPVAFAAAAIALGLLFPQQQPEAVAANQGQENPIGDSHSSPPTWYTSSAPIQATTHWEITTANVFHLLPSSRRMVATAATQGV